MTQDSRNIGVVIGRRRVDNPWIDHIWVPHAVLVQTPDVAAWTLISEEGDLALHYAGEATIELFASETANYRDNLASGDPRLWIACRSREGGATPEFLRATADPTEGEAFFEGGADVVGTVAMPAEINAWIAAFVEAFHVERVFHKRQRDGDGARRGRRREGET
jgi:hypothetical protein